MNRSTHWCASEAKIPNHRFLSRIEVGNHSEPADYSETCLRDRRGDTIPMVVFPITR